MSHLLSGEFYKWKKSKSFKVCLLVAIAMGIFLYVSLMIEAKEYCENPQELYEEIGLLGVLGESVSSGMELMFTSIFSCIWVISEYSHGAIKNIVGKGDSRAKIFLTKCVSSFIAVTLMNLICYLVMLITGFAVMGTKQVDAGFFGNFLNYAGMQLLFSIAFTSIVIAICELTRNMAAGITISLVLIMFSNLFSGGLNCLFEFFHINIKPSTYWIIDLISECPMEAMDFKFFGRGIVVAVVWSVLPLVLATVHFKRTDIK